MPVRSARLSPRDWHVVEVSGPSMAPTLRHGDRVLARRVSPRTPDVRPGEIVLARFRALPDLLVIKRAAEQRDGGWWLASDNPFAGGDSESHGIADVTARVLWLVAPGRPRRLHRSAPPAVPD